MSKEFLLSEFATESDKSTDTLEIKSYGLLSDVLDDYFYPFDHC